VVDRDKLGERIRSDGAALARLEAIIHPLVRRAEDDFRARMAAAGTRLVLLDIPLLLETGGEARVDAVVVVTAPEPVQKERLLSREGMTAERLAPLLARQMPDAEKRRRAHFVIDTSGDFPETRAAVAGVLRALGGMAGA
jgi:dephospho-CoA kinase